jgi:hypothetical protein
MPKPSGLNETLALSAIEVLNPSPHVGHTDQEPTEVACVFNKFPQVILKV